MAEKPLHWSDEDWAEYQRWHQSLPEDVEVDGARHMVMIGRKGDIIPDKPSEEDQDASDAEAPEQRPP